MTPKEKARELINQFEDENYFSEETILSVAKDTTIQVVDILIKENNLLDNFQVEFTKKLAERLEYWEAVKKAIIDIEINKK